LLWLHLACGVVAGVVILIMCVTGVALTYQRQMQYWADTRDYRSAPPTGAERAPATAILDAVRAAEPDAQPTTIAYRADPSLPAAVAIGPRTIYVNPYTAQVYGEGRGQGLRQFFTTMTTWHRYLGQSGESRPTGRMFTGASNLLFLCIVLSGMYLWWPKALTWKQIRNVTWFRGGLRAKARDFNWHNTIGFWSALPLAVIVYSGVVMSYPWANNMVYRVMGEQPPPPGAGRGGPGGGRGEGGAREGGRGGRGVARGEGRGGPGARAMAPTGAMAMTDAPRATASDADAQRPSGIGLDAAIARAMAAATDWNILTLRVPTSDRAPISFSVDQGDGGQPQARSTLTVDATTGAVTQTSDFGAQTPGRRMRSILRFAHTGEILGLSGQTIAGLVSAGGAVLVYTGISLALRRFFAWIRRRATARGDRTAGASQSTAA
jgi:uncharacterized iron-regulated membrane protein